ncbi:LysR family transcriptional regulator [Microbacterium gorillae]|uniref:LysR family transcriptional regulator n=1 Tax=Microbacterium gorillae TaxID=1231063 RepID=UPI00058EAE09|nr:LysR substrate-binding domain-containing protein [Microbacterium gorillae]
MLDVRRLRLLVELAHRETLAAVAEALNYSPSSVSEQLRILEREVGTPLLEQSGRRVRLTPQARVLVEHAEAILDRMAEAESDIARSGTGVGGTVRIAVFQSAAHAIMPAALTHLATDHPDLRVEVVERPPEQGLFEVAARGFDLAVAEEYPGHLRPRHPDLDHVPFAFDPIRAAAADEVAAFTDLASRAWVMEPAGTAARQWAMQLCRAAGFEPDVRYETGDLIAHLRLIRSGHAVGLLPDLLWAGEPPTVRLLDLPGDPQRVVFSAARRAAADRPAVRAVRAALSAAVDHG